tara:strand:+ start:1231 stop:1935 length:705 start_codon:yes stop_codon:yes gene_type:complete
MATQNDTTNTTRPYTCDDGAVSGVIHAESPEAAAQEWAASGWEPANKTIFVEVNVDVDGEWQRFDVPVEPEAPACTSDEHEWERPFSLVGGNVENPGVRGKGRGVVITEVCANCGLVKRTDTSDEECRGDIVEFDEGLKDDEGYAEWVKFRSVLRPDHRDAIGARYVNDMDGEQAWACLVGGQGPAEFMADSDEPVSEDAVRDYIAGGPYFYADMAAIEAAVEKLAEYIDDHID